MSELTRVTVLFLSHVPYLRYLQDKYAQELKRKNVVIVHVLYASYERSSYFVVQVKEH